MAVRDLQCYCIMSISTVPLYYVKRNGRNQTQVYERLEAEGKLDASIAATGGVELF